MPDQGPEPTGWELMRGLSRIEQRLTEMSAAFVSQTVFEAEQRAIHDRFEGQGREIAELKASAVKSKERADDMNARSEDQRVRNRWQLIMLVASPVVTLVIGWIAIGGLRT